MRRLALALALLVPAAAAAAPPLRGVALSLYGGSEPGAALDEIAATGASHVALAVFWRQRDIHDLDLGPGAPTIPDERLVAAIRRARRAKLEVFLLPIIDVEVRRPREWRGTLAPGDIDAWWMRYERFILHYADIAAAEDVALFAVGSELVSTEAWRDRWYHLASKVRARYRGKLVYSANWDHYDGVSFWERMDYVGVTGYNELTGSTEEDFTAGWNAVRDKLTAYARSVDRPLVITEVGYTSHRGAAAHPWDYTLSSPLDLEEQRRCYAAFVAAWRDDPALAGVFFWEWGDPQYSPRGRPAEKVLKSWFGLK
jgi:glycosyl hydrolase family 113